MKKRSIFNKFVENLKIIGKTLAKWAKRAFFGSSKELSLLEEEAVQSPIRVTINKFFHKKLAIISLAVFVAIFAFCFIGSAFTEGGEMYMDIGQKDTAPGFNLLSVPSELNKNGIAKIATGTTYSVGIDKKGKVYVWGNSLKDLYEGFYQVETSDNNLYYKVDVTTGEYVEVTDSEIYNIKKSIKLLNKSGLKAKNVFAGPDSFFIVLEDNTVRGYGLKGDSMSYSSAILTQEVYEQAKKEGIYNITMDNQVVALFTNDTEGSTHNLHIWGNIGTGKNRPQPVDAIVRSIKKEGLNPIDLRWTRDTLVILFDNGTYRTYGANENIVVSSQPSKKVETLTTQIKDIQLSLLEIFGSQINGYNAAVSAINAQIAELEAAFATIKATELETKAAVSEAKTALNEAKVAVNNAELALKADPENATLKAELKAAQETETLAQEKYTALQEDLEATTAMKEKLDAEIETTKANVEVVKLTFAEEAEKLAMTSSEYQIQTDKLFKYKSELEVNKEYVTAINTYGIKQIRATKGNIIALLNNGTIITWGDNNSKENQIPAEYQGKFVSIEGDTKGAENSSHIIALTEDGTFVAWGSDAQNATKLPSKLNSGKTTKVFSNYYQNFAVDENGKIVAKWGLSGYAFGTDDSGRSIFLRVMHGGKISLTIGLIAVIISSVIGIIVGGISGFYGGWVDILMMRLGEIVSSIPFMPIAMTLALVCNELGFRDPEQRMMMIMLILGVLSWPGLASLIRAHILAEREKEFVTAAQAIGVKTNKIIFRHIIPNVITIIIISITSSYASSLLTESGLSFLGFGVEPPTPSWGNMLTGAQNMNVIRQYWWRWVFPSIFLCSATICINLIGDCIRDAIDPRSTER